MTLRALVEKEVYIRLIEDEMTLVSTIRYGLLRKKVTAFPVVPTSVAAPEENDLVRVRNRFRIRYGSL